MNTEMANMNHMLTDPTGSGLLAHALGVQTGPCAFLAVVPAMAAGETRIEVVHCTRQYIIPATQPNSATDPLQGRMILFMGEITNNQLPIIFMEPPTGLHAYFAFQQTPVPDMAFVETFYSTHGVQDLIPSCTVAANLVDRPVRYLTFIPLPFVPAFIDGLFPREGLNRATEIIQFLPAADRAQFEYLSDFLRATCHRNTGANAESKMLVPLANPGRDALFIQWCVLQIMMYFPAISGSAQGLGPPPPPMGPGGIDFNALGASLSSGLSTGIAAALMTAQQLAAPLQSAKAKEDWSPLLQEQVLKLMGLPADHDFITTAPPVWQEIVAEGKTMAAVERVLKSKFRVDADNPDAPDITPFMSRRTAQDILDGRFAPQELALDGTIQGIMPLAFPPRSGAEQNDAAQDDDDEDRATYISTEAVQARRIKAAAKAKAPKNYADMMDALRAASMAWTVLFGSACPWIQSLNVLRSALSSQKEQLKESMTPGNVAGLMWSVSMATHSYILAPYDAYGVAPQPRFELMISAARGCMFQTPINIPAGFSSQEPMPPRQMHNQQLDLSFGEAPHQGPPVAVHTNPNVNPVIKALCDKLRQADPYVTMMGLLRNSPVSPGQLVLVEGNCLDFHAFGMCRRGASCNFRHDATARPTPERVQNFMDLVKPIAEGYPGRKPAKRARGGGAGG
jgi:hypothetical protein